MDEAPDEMILPKQKQQKAKWAPLTPAMGEWLDNIYNGYTSKGNNFLNIMLQE